MMNPWDLTGGSSRAPRAPTLDEELAALVQAAATKKPEPIPAAAAGGAPKPRKVTTKAPAPATVSMEKAPPTVNEVLNIGGVARGSGLENKAYEKQIEELKKALEDQTKTGSKDVRAQFLSPQEFAGLVETAQGSKFYKDQAAGLDRLEADINNRLGAREIQPDIATPLGDLAGFLTKGRYKHTSQPRMTGPERDKLLLEHMSKLQNDRRDLAKTALDSVSKQKYGTLEQALGRVITLKDETKNTNDAGTSATASDPNKFDKPGKGTGAYDPTRDTQRLQKSMEPLAALHSSFEGLKGAIERDIGGPLASWDGKKDVSGIGKTGLIPTGMLSDSGANIREQWQNLKNQVIYATSGKAITEAEGGRLNAAIGGKIWNTDRDAIIGIQNLERELKEIFKQREAQIRGIPKKGGIVIDAYRKGGGKTSDDFGNAPGWQPPAPAGAFTPKSDAELNAMSQKDLDAYLNSLGAK